MSPSSGKQKNNSISDRLKNIEARLDQIEARLKLRPGDQEIDESTSSLIPENISETMDILEFRIGQYWFAKAGIIVLALGIVFLMTFPYQTLPSFFPSLIGYILVAGILTLSYLWRESLAFISRYLLGGGLILLYFATLRLHFFSDKPVLSNNAFFLALLIIVVLISLIIAAKRKSVYLSSLILTLGYVTAVVSENSIIIFGILTLMAIVTVYLKLKYKWEGLFIYGIILTYFFHLIWFINNPFLGNRIQLVSSPGINTYFILLYAIIFALGNLLRSKEILENNFVIISTFLNSFGAYSLYFLITITKFSSHLVFSHLLASIVFLSLAIIFWTKEKSKFSTFFFAILGYSALSVAIITQFKLPNYFVWLCWQSLLVVTTALWFRSKIIVVANFVIFVIIFLAYIMISIHVGLVSISFGVVALLSARIMNWQRHRLELKTELMRNAYLFMAFVAIPYALYHSLPGRYISLSWVAVAIFYYLLSLVLKNKKYRWMALFTLLLSILYIFVIGIIKLEPVYRIVSFIVLGIVLIIISIAYAKIRAKTESDRKDKNSG
jgi:hypothetical protein